MRWTRGTVLAPVGLLLVLGLAVVTAIEMRPPAPAPASAPATEFSAERAFPHIEAVAQAPRPVGSAEHQRVQEHLVSVLTDLGLQPEIHEAVGIYPHEHEGLIPAGNVQNIVATVEGTDPTGQVVLAAHYDSVPSGPGANDDGVGIAAILETVRALQERATPPRNDVTVLLTDGEELGLLGAEAFVNDHPLADRDSIVLNHEARGGGGNVHMFRLTEGSGDLIRLFATVAPYPVAESAAADLFELLPNDTDFVAFDEGGLDAMDFAYAGDSAHYHSITDTPENVSPGTVQQMGANTLAMTTTLAAADLTARAERSERVYFDVPPGLLVHVPPLAMVVLGVLALGVSVGTVVVARRKGRTTVPRVLAGVGLTVGLLVVGAGAATGYWAGLVQLQPGFASLLTGTPYVPEWFQLGILVLTVAVAAAWYALLRRRVGIHGLTFGALNTVAVAGALAAVLLPGTSAWFVLPALGAGVAGLICTVAEPDSGWRAVALTVGLTPTAVFLLAGAWINFEVGLAMSPYLSVPLALLGIALVLPLADLWWHERRLIGLPVVGLVLAAIAAGVGLAFNPMDETQPVPASLAYTFDADTGEAYWASPIHPLQSASAPTDWAAQYVGDQIGDDPTPGTEWPEPQAYVRPAEPLDAEAPEVQILDDTTEDGVRTVALQITSLRGADHLGMEITDHADQIEEVTVAGRRMEPEPNDDGLLTFAFFALPDDHTLTVEIVTASDAPLPIQVGDIALKPSALDEVPGYEPPPDDVYLQHSQVSVIRSINL